LLCASADNSFQASGGAARPSTRCS
jgi:hypothetical protein